MNEITKEMLKKLPHKSQVAFAVFCAKQVFHLVKEEHKAVCTKAIEAAEGFIYGNATAEECGITGAAADAAYTAAYAVAADAAAYAADAGAYAAYAAAYAAGVAYGTNKQEIVHEQIRYYEELLNFDSLVENTLFDS